MKAFKILIPILLISSCISNKNNQNLTEYNETFDDFKESFLSLLWEFDPDAASWAGLHSYDSILILPDSNYRMAFISKFDSLNNVLNEVIVDNLHDGNKIDYYLMHDFIQYINWSFSHLRTFEWNASEYNIATRAGTIINENFTSLNNRMRILSAFLKHVPGYYQQAALNLKTPTLEHIELAIIQNKGGLTLFNNALNDSIRLSNLTDSEKETLQIRINKTKEAISGYVTQLEELKLNDKPESYKSPRLGKELFFKKFDFEISSQNTAEENYQKALENKKYVQRQMVSICDTLWEKYFPNSTRPDDSLIMVNRIIEKISDNRIQPSELFPTIQKQIEQLVNFVDEKDLLTQDTTKPLVVRVLPPYMRGGGSIASINSPGPYESNANTYYNVASLDDYTEKDAENLLREYNIYMLQILNIHEAIPGHYTQLVYANKSPSVIKSVLANGAMIEGWAEYVVTMMLEEGYQASAELWLMRYKMQLRVITNSILDYEYHVLNLDKEKAMKLMIKDAFQNEAEAANKWRRVKLSSVQLSSYFSGLTDIYELRDEMKEKKGESFKLKEFHEQFLSYGNAPVKYIRKFMIEN